jgi:hypothetical protein
VGLLKVVLYGEELLQKKKVIQLLSIRRRELLMSEHLNGLCACPCFTVTVENYEVYVQQKNVV